MAFADFLNHSCDIYHITMTGTSPGYGLPSSPKGAYPAVPDIANVQCHFTQGATGGTVNTVVQNEPQKNYEDRIKLILPIGTDIRSNDKVRDGRTGYDYIAEIPRTVREHHVYVYVKRFGSEAGL